MNIEPLRKSIYDTALKLGVSRITLNFSGGSDEGYLDVDIEVNELTPWTDEHASLNRTIEDWAWEVYQYGGAGDGSDYGDRIVYDLLNNTVSASEWSMQRVDGGTEELALSVEDDSE